MRQITDDDFGMNEYAAQATKTADYPELGSNIIYPALGLAGEAGEVAEKVKKLWRNRGKKAGILLTPDEKETIIKELGDCMWYVAAMCNEIGSNMSAVAYVNLDKLRDRKERGVIKSEGDNR